MAGEKLTNENPPVSGRGLRIFDVHTHAFPDALAPKAIPKLEASATWFECRALYDGTIGGLLASMDRAGVSRAVVCSIATRPEQVAKITDWSRQVASERIVPFASIHPDSPDPEAEAERVAAAGLRGLKFHPYYADCPVDDPRVVRIARAAARNSLAMMLHAGYDLSYEKNDLASPLAVRRLHEAVPNLRMAAAHLGGWERWQEVRDILVGLPIYFETSFTMGRCPEDLLLEILSEHPAEYLLFGTDGPWTDQQGEVEKFLALPLADDLKRRIMWENAIQYLNLPAAR